MLIIFHCRQTFIKDTDGKPYILILFACISGFTLASRISFLHDVCIDAQKQRNIYLQGIFLTIGATDT